MAHQRRIKRRGQAATSWHVDETSVSVHGKWCSLSRAIERDGKLVDSMVSAKPDRAAAQRFFKQAVDVVGHAPEPVRPDGPASSPRAIRQTLGNEVIHRCHHSLTPRIEQDHRGIKQRSDPMRGFGNGEAAACFCRAFDALPNSFGPRHTMGETVS